MHKKRSWLIVIFVVVILSAALYVAINSYGKRRVEKQANFVSPNTQILQPVPVAKKTVIAKQAGQFACPVHGATGLPDYNINGESICQMCERKMEVIYFK